MAHHSGDRMDQLQLDDLLAGLRESPLARPHMDSGDDPRLPPYFHKSWGIHGVGHARRVLLLSLMLAHLNGLGPEEFDLLAQASLYHDIGRTHDNTCLIHGKASYRKMTELGLINIQEPEGREALRLVVETHCIPDREALAAVDTYRFRNTERARMLLTIFKDADGLDRVRLGDLNPRYLRNPFARRLVPVSHDLLKLIRSGRLG
ncbi:MAG: HD domain-containing protein [Bacillota bacterium]|nr:HD domain-containing protein [Bacillota bacterium]